MDTLETYHCQNLLEPLHLLIRGELLAYQVIMVLGPNYYPGLRICDSVTRVLDALHLHLHVLFRPYLVLPSIIAATKIVDT
jgi:hypothetical protein